MCLEFHVLLLNLLYCHPWGRDAEMLLSISISEQQHDISNYINHCLHFSNPVKSPCAKSAHIIWLIENLENFSKIIFQLQRCKYHYAINNI